MVGIPACRRRLPLRRRRIRCDPSRHRHRDLVPGRRALPPCGCRDLVRTSSPFPSRSARQSSRPVARSRSSSRRPRSRSSEPRNPAVTARGEPTTHASRSINPIALSEELTDREWDVLAHLANRRTEQDIARRMGIRPGTVRSHKARIRRKLHVDPDLRLSEFARSNFRELIKRLEKISRSNRADV